MLGTVQWKEYISFCKIRHLYNFCNGLSVLSATVNNHTVADMDIIFIGKVIIVFVHIIKFHAAINVVCTAALVLPIDCRIEYLATSIEPNSLVYGLYHTSLQDATKGRPCGACPLCFTQPNNSK